MLNSQANRSEQLALLSQQGTEVPPPLPFHSRDEMNLAEFPLAVLSTRVNATVKTLEFSDTQRLPNGEVTKRQWIITAADKFGLPTATDDDVLLGLMRLSMDQGFRDRKVFFTRYELLRILRWTTEGRSYTRLTKSLDRLSGVRIRAANAFFDNESKAYQTCNFGIIDAYEINDGRSVSALSHSAEHQKSFFLWSEVLFSSFRAGFIKKLDLNIYFSLRSAISRRLYRYLDKHFYYRTVVDKPLVTLAFEKLGLSRNYSYISQIKQQLEPALEELIANRFLARFEYLGAGAETVLRFEAASPARRIARDQAPRSTEGVREEPITSERLLPVREKTVPRNELIEALLSRGIQFHQASRLLNDKSDEELKRIDEIIVYYDYLVATNDKKISRNRIGFLYRAVELPHRFVIPRTFPGKRKSIVRPERRLVQPKSVSRERTRNELTNRASEGDVVHTVERNLHPLRAVLSSERFDEAVRGCVRNELAKRRKVASSRTS